MRVSCVALAFVFAASAAQAQIISVDAYKTQLDVGVVETDLLLYERKNKVYALFTVKGPFEQRATELNVSRDGCDDILFSGRHKDGPFTLSLTACSSAPHCENERQILTVRAIYRMMTLGDGRPPQIKAAPIVKSIRPGLRNLPC